MIKINKVQILFKHRKGGMTHDVETFTETLATLTETLISLFVVKSE